MALSYIGIDIAKATFCLAIPHTNGRFRDYILANTRPTAGDYSGFCSS